MPTVDMVLMVALVHVEYVAKYKGRKCTMLVISGHVMKQAGVFFVVACK